MSTAYVSDSKRFYKNILSKVFLILSFEYVPSNNVVWKQFKYLCLSVTDGMSISVEYVPSKMLESNFDIYVSILQIEWVLAREVAETYKIPKSTLGDEISWKSAQAVTVRKNSFSHESKICK